MNLHEDWMSVAACRGLDHELFFPERGDGATITEAKAVCSTCPIRSDCLGYALEHRIKHGVWGGTSERERRRMRTVMRGAA